MHLPRRCPITDVCGARWHFTEEAIDQCLAAEEADIAERAEDHETWAESTERREREKQAAKRALATAAHIPATLSEAGDRAVSFYGEKQLLALSPWQLPVIGLLMTTSIFYTNRLLRRGSTLEQGAGAAIDWAGYRSNQAFVDDAHTIFADLGNALVFDEPMKLFRGISVPAEPHESAPDVAGIGGHLVKSTAWDAEYVELGFSFAAMKPNVARQYPLESSGGAGEVRVLLELEATSGLCVPRQGNRSVELFDLTYSAPYLATEACQVIFPPGTHWDVISIDKESDYGVPLVRMKQKTA